MWHLVHHSVCKRIFHEPTLWTIFRACNECHHWWIKRMQRNIACYLPSWQRSWQSGLMIAPVFLITKGSMVITRSRGCEEVSKPMEYEVEIEAGFCVFFYRVWDLVQEKIIKQCKAMQEETATINPGHKNKGRQMLTMGRNKGKRRGLRTNESSFRRQTVWHWY